MIASASSEGLDEIHTFYSSLHSEFCKNIPKYSIHALNLNSQHVTTAQRNTMENVQNYIEYLYYKGHVLQIQNIYIFLFGKLSGLLEKQVHVWYCPTESVRIIVWFKRIMCIANIHLHKYSCTII